MTRSTRRRLERVGVVVCGLILAALAAFVTHDTVAQTRRAELQRQADAALSLQARTVESILAKHRHLPAQLAHRTDVRALFAGGGTGGVSIATDVAGLSGASDIAFLDRTGRFVASARDRFTTLDTVTLARIMSGPREGRLGRTVVAPEEAYGAPGYVFSYPVRGFDGAVVGVSAVMVDLARIEEIWALSLDAIRTRDSQGRLVVGNDVEPSATAVTAARILPQVGWRLDVSRDAGSAGAAARSAAGFAALIVLVLAALAFAWTWRRQTARHRARRDRAAALVLERRVRDRTRELQAAQAELVQTAKLAALGRMSAALAHEYAQPLAAIRTYAENAGTLIEHDRAQEVPQTLDRVVAMAERMRSLSQTLRSFAREPGSAVRPISLRDAFQDARTLAEPEARRRNVTIRFEGEADATVLGGHVRLSQVFLNLLTNAIAASPSGGTVTVALTTEAGAVVRVCDEGPGVAANLRDQVFEPFFTTKPVGEGLGLGLAIAYNVIRDFGGSLQLVPSDRGAMFELRLQLAQALVEAAQ